MSAKIEYNGSVVATVESGKVATLPVKDKKMATNIKVTAEKDAPILQAKEVTPTKSTQTITADSGKDGLSQVTVNPIPSEYIVPSGTKSITENGTHNVNEFANATVNVRPPLQDKAVTPAKNSQVISPDDSYYGLSEVTVNPIPSEYIVPSGTINISENKTVDVTQYAKATINVQVEVWDGTGITTASL